jgi:DNA-binding response OmpR family regulator
MDRQIIIVTRDAQLRDALERVCSGQGYRVETADSVATALEIAVRWPVIDRQGRQQRADVQRLVG